MITQGLETLIPCLDEPSKEIKLLAAEIISKICNIRKARRAMRTSTGIKRLVGTISQIAKKPNKFTCFLISSSLFSSLRLKCLMPLKMIGR